MKATPIQISLCVTCALLLLAKLREWWQGLSTATAPTPLPLTGEVAVRQVVPQTSPPPPAPVEIPDPVEVEHAPPPPPVHDAIDERVAELKAHGEREIMAARLRAQSMQVNAEAQARQILEDAEREVARIAARAPRVEAPAAEAQAARRQGEREGHAIGLRKGEMEALSRIESVFERIEGVLMQTTLPC